MLFRGHVYAYLDDNEEFQERDDEFDVYQSNELLYEQDHNDDQQLIIVL